MNWSEDFNFSTLIPGCSRLLPDDGELDMYDLDVKYDKGPKWRGVEMEIIERLFGIEAKKCIEDRLRA